MISITDNYGGPMTNLGDNNYMTSYGRIINIMTNYYGVNYWIKNLETGIYISVSEYRKMLSVDNRDDSFGELFS